MQSDKSNEIVLLLSVFVCLFFSCACLAVIFGNIHRLRRPSTVCVSEIVGLIQNTMLVLFVCVDDQQYKDEKQIQSQSYVNMYSDRLQ